MKKIFLFFIFTAAGFSAADLSAAGKTPSIFACEPEWAALATEIAGDRAKTYSATAAAQDAHYIQAKPGLMAKIRNSDIVICSGAELETGWLPLILRKAGSSKVQEGGENLIYAADYVETIEKPARIDRSEGDVHPEGNPHIHLNPYNMLKIADILTEKLSAADPENAEFYSKSNKTFQKKFSAKIKEWEKKAAPLAGKNIITNHKNMSYLFSWLKIKTSGTLEPKPGIPATSKHLAGLKDMAKTEKIYAVVYAPFESPRAAKWLSRQTGIKYIMLPYTVGGNAQSKTLYGLYENSIDILLEADDK